jgi:hypothetical protein
MIRNNPAHDTKNPPGCYQFEMPLHKLIEEYKTHELYQKGYAAGFADGVASSRNIPKALLNSEYAR